MRLQGRAIADFLRAPDPRVRAILLYGPDSGLVQERALALTALVAEDASDPFRVAVLAAEVLKKEPARLGDEAATLSLTDGRRVVRVRDADDDHAPAFETFLGDATGDALVIAEAGDLRPRSALRRLFEGADNAAALPCYVDDARTLGDLIADTLKDEGIGIETAALSYLVDHLGGDRLVSRRELEKLVLYMGSDTGEARVVSLEDAMLCVGDSAALSLDDVAFAAAAGDQAGLDRGLARSLLAGATAVQALRAMARHLQRLHLASAVRDRGSTIDQAMVSLRPKVFFKQTAGFKRQLQRWSTADLARALDIVTTAERACKSTGIPADTVCSRALMRVANAARAPRP